MWRTDDRLYYGMCEGETLWVLYGMSVEEKLMTLLWHVCGGERTVVWYV